ncbi:zinc finger protein 25-like [Hyperolius riggenbachi]|uniref:zinc finger protein 25-like n=1 Tax=Hyperolius riggenbachi TaxID=752182 RepID=UPI0035A2916C
MEKDQSNMTERVFNLTVEIISLLTGKRFCPVKSGDHVTIMVPPPQSLISVKHNMQKILELTRKMMELVLIEERQHFDEHKDLQKDTLLENQSPLTTLDGSSNRAPPERCTGSLYSWNYPWEDLTISQQYSEEEMIHVKVVVKEEEDEISVTGKQEGDMRASKEIHIAPSPCITNHSRVYQTVSPECGVQDDVITRNSSGRNTITPLPPCPPNPQKADARAQQRIHTAEMSYKCSECGKCFSTKLSLAAHKRNHTRKGSFFCTECGQHFVQKSHLSRHELSHTDEKPFSCDECGKWFIWKGNLVAHQKSHIGYPCSECGKCFARKSQLDIHARSHPYKTLSCHVCGKFFVHRSQLVRHEKAHIEKPFSCSECGKCYAWKSSLVTHLRSHTGDKPFLCTECGKRFIFKSYLAAHERAHRVKKQYGHLI